MINKEAFELHFGSFTYLYPEMQQVKKLFEVMWDLAEKSTLRERTQVAAIEQPKHFDIKVIRWPEVINSKKHGSDRQFTHSELQILKKMLAEKLQSIEVEKSIEKAEVNHAWKLANENTLVGRFWFGMLNAARNKQRSLKAKYAKLSALQKKLKGM